MAGGYELPPSDPAASARRFLRLVTVLGEFASGGDLDDELVADAGGEVVREALANAPFDQVTERLAGEFTTYATIMWIAVQKIALTDQRDALDVLKELEDALEQKWGS